MRVIGGEYRGRNLRTPKGLAVRPTSDRMRETLFNIVAPVIEGSRFLDICAGSGAVGIEALSRGASLAVFVDVSRRSCAVIEENLAQIGISNGTQIINRDALAALRRLDGESEQFDIIFFDPPYESELYSQAMNLIASSTTLAREGLVVVEHRAKTPPESEYGDLRAYREVRQGESSLAFYMRI